MITLSNENSVFRPLKYEGRELHGIVFYGGGQVYYRVGQGWLENCPINPVCGTPSRGSRDVISITLADDVVRARKENLNRTDNYVLPHENWHEKGWVLYIYLESPPKELGEFETDRTDEKVYYNSYIEIPLVCVSKEAKLDNDGKIVWERVTLNSVILKSGSRSEMTVLGSLLAEKMEELKSHDIKIHDDVLKKLLEKYDLVLKK